MRPKVINLYIPNRSLEFDTLRKVVESKLGIFGYDDRRDRPSRKIGSDRRSDSPKGKIRQYARGIFEPR